MSKESQKDQTKTTETNRDDTVRTSSSRSGSRVSPRPVSDRSSWSGLLTRTFNILSSKTHTGQGDDSRSTAVLAGMMFIGAFITGAIPLPLTWIGGIAAGSIIGAKTENGSLLSATGIAALIGFVFGLTFAPALFGLGVIVTLILTVVSAAIGGISFLLLE
ncbi:hypothetical protein [Haloquadratum walsbyi]|jgi:hypothetical protein|uniref:Uncharacterized protein n=1 Tax=Haloquadratum walsbyi J07HQW2 TaxID=1238425 RepID=U1NIH6_9EURY|nr:hypothetical protein [Haloquadratum walsbyi]ERG97000.1 MAG: hypothetical protein J07HQW2_03486 [Haloquadratum walsbyi J07HQW2]